MKRVMHWIKNWSEVIMIAILMAGLVFAYWQVTQSADESRYRYLAGVWNDIMKESIQHPEFNDESKTLVYTEAFVGDRRRQYDAYVRWVGGFVEDLYVNKYEERGDEYYEPWIETVLEIHRTWLLDHIHYYTYTPAFRQRLEELKAHAPNKALEATPDSAPQGKR